MANNRKRLIGRVVSDKMTKTVVVAIERRKRHPVYGKIIISTKKLMAHDESDAVKIGSVVRVVESKPLSKNKRWVVEVVLETPEGIVLAKVSKTAVVQVQEQETTPSTGEEN